MNLRFFWLLPAFCLLLPACKRREENAANPTGPNAGAAAVNSSSSTPAGAAAASHSKKAAATPKNWMWDEKRPNNPLGQKSKSGH